MTETLTNLPVLTAIKLLTIALGFLVVHRAAKAYRATKRRSLLFLTLGLAVLTLGVLSEGIAYQGLQALFGRDLQWTLDQSHLFEALVTLVAFAILVHSLYVKE